MDLITKDLDIVTKLLSNENFSFSRFGDGEFNAIRQKKGQNCDAHKYFPDMGVRLLNILESSPNYYIGCQNLAYNQSPEYINELTTKHNLSWCKNEILHHLSIKGNMSDFWNALKGKRIILVAPERMKDLKEVEVSDHVIIPLIDCWLSYNDIKEKLSNIIKENDVVLYCASMMANVLIDDFSKENITQIDCGSALEPFIGVANRSYHKNLNIKNINK